MHKKQTCLGIQASVKALQQEQVIIYPTETFYGLGANALSHKAVEQVVSLKNRPKNKPLPLIIGNWEQFLSFASPDSPLIKLTRLFWPGPLSVLIRLKIDLPRSVQDENGFTSLRMTPHPLAQKLCLKLNAPLVATSANFSGQPPAQRPDLLDQDLVSLTCGVLAETPWPAGGLPSTLVRLQADHQLEVLRAGALTVSDLQSKGYIISNLDEI